VTQLSPRAWDFGSSTARSLKVLLSDPAVRWLALARAAQLAMAPLILWLALVRLSDEGRALYGIVANIALLGSVFEQGPGTILAQIASHLPPASLRSLMAEAVRWYRRVALMVLIVVLVIGLLGLRSRFALPGAVFLPAWCALSFLVATYLPLIPSITVREGNGATIVVQRMRALQSLVSGVVTVVALTANMPLIAGIGVAATQLAVAVLFSHQAARLADAETGIALEAANRFRRERGRSLFVWLALWGAPQLVTPLVVIASGAAAAGPIAIGMALTLAPFVMAMAWLQGRYASFGAHVASGDVKSLERDTQDATRHALLVFTMLALVVLGIQALLSWWRPVLSERILSSVGLILLLLAHAAMLLIQAMLAWARAFAEETLAHAGVAACVLMAVGAAFGAVVNGALGAAMGYMLGSLVGLLAVTIHFTSLRRHKIRPC
jgi:hypothetical protein